MKLIDDTNRIIAALIKDSTSRKILLSDEFEFLTVAVIKKEIEKYKQDILQRAKITEEEFRKIYSKLFSKIFIVEDTVIGSKFDEAKKIMDKIDPKDTPFLALALAVENDGIWSDDTHFEKQTKIKVWKTKDMIKFL